MGGMIIRLDGGGTGLWGIGIARHALVISGGLLPLNVFLLGV